MSLNLRKASYSREPISSVKSLAAALRLEKDVLIELAANASSLYRPVKLKAGSSRQVFDAKGLLKTTHRRLKSQVFSNVIFPDYLTGSIKGRDYKTNAKLHAGKQVVICEDVKSFFPSVSRDAVYAVWRGFFKFSPAVAEVLTDLTTKDGVLPQGAIPSSYIANLVLWKYEPLLEAKFAARGITYSRYVDDMAMSSRTKLSKEELTANIGEVFGMLRRAGLSAGRHKHEIFTASRPMIVTKLVVNRKPSLPKKKRADVRSAMVQLELSVSAGVTPVVVKAASELAHRIGQLGRFHPQEASKLRLRLKSVKDVIDASGLTFATTSSSNAQASTANASPSENALPWE